MSLKQSKRLQHAETDLASSDLLGLWFEVNGDRFVTAAEDLGHLALVSQKCRCLVAEKVRLIGSSFH